MASRKYVGVLVKDPDAVLDFGFDWTKWLGDSDTIASSEWVIPDGLTLTSEGLNTNQAVAWVSGGTNHVDYVVTNRVTTTAGRVDDRSILLQVRQR